MANRERSRVLKKSFLKNQNGLGGAKPLKAKRTTGLKAPSEAAHSTDPVVVQFRESITAMDALSTVGKEAVEEVSPGIAW